MTFPLSEEASMNLSWTHDDRVSEMLGHCATLASWALGHSGAPHFEDDFDMV